MFTQALLSTAIRVLAVIGGYSVAGWIGVGIVAAFIAVQIIDIQMRLRSPKARFLRDISRTLSEANDDAQFAFRIRHVDSLAELIETEDEEDDES
jgi:hypothetical protein